MRQINFKSNVSGKFEEVVEQVTNSLKSEGFGILTRIDLHAKFKEKLDKLIAPATILGACNPQLAYEAYLQNSDVASLLPCNAVVREISPGTCSVELARPTAMMELLGDAALVELSRDADLRLQRCLERLRSPQAA